MGEYENPHPKNGFQTNRLGSYPASGSSPPLGPHSLIIPLSYKLVLNTSAGCSPWQGEAASNQRFSFEFKTCNFPDIVTRLTPFEKESLGSCQNWISDLWRVCNSTVWLFRVGHLGLNSTILLYIVHLSHLFFISLSFYSLFFCMNQVIFVVVLCVCF